MSSATNIEPAGPSWRQ